MNGCGDGEDYLDKIKDVTPVQDCCLDRFGSQNGAAADLDQPRLEALVGKTFCALVHDSDISMDHDSEYSDRYDGSLKGSYKGIIAFRLDEVRTNSWDHHWQKEAVVTVLDADTVC